MDPKASVIIPVYNAERTLRRCVESLVLGLERDIEVILCEDCSKDNSWDLCCALAKEFSNVLCVQNEKNRGVSYTRNAGLRKAHGEYILFVDSDDWVSQKYVHSLLNLAKNHPEALSLCGHHFIDKVNTAKQDYLWGSNSVKEILLKERGIFDLCDKFLLQQLWNKIFRRDIIEAHHIQFDETQSMGEDFQFVLDYMEAAQIKTCAVLNEALYYYIRWNNASLMSKFGFIDNRPEFERIEQLSRIVGSGAEARKDAMIAQIKRNYIYHIVRNRHHSKCEKLNAIETVMEDGNAANHYRKQLPSYAKETIKARICSWKNLYNRFHAKINREKIKKKITRSVAGVNAENITFISQNCIGGVLYHDLGLPFLSPTINTFIPEPDFVKLVLDLRSYMEQELVIQWDEAYPVGILGDIQIHFMHYETCKEAKEAWERRKARINWDKILILGTDRDGFDASVYEQWKQIQYPKVLFTAHPEFSQDAIFYPEYEADGQIGDLISDRKFYHERFLAEKIVALVK